MGRHLLSRRPLPVGQIPDLSSPSALAARLQRSVAVSTILAVDSEPDLLVTYSRLLTREGYRVVALPSRIGGLLALDREAPDLVIVTLSLRDGSGLDVIRAARELETPAAAILVSRFSVEAFRQAARDVGAAFLVKPFETAVLLNLVRSLLPIPSRPVPAGEHDDLPTEGH